MEQISSVVTSTLGSHNGINFFISDEHSQNPFITKAKEGLPSKSIEKIHTTGISNIFYLPQSFFSSIKSLLTALCCHDKEGIIEYAIKLVSIPLGLTCAIENLVILLLLRSTVLTALTISTITFGSIFITIEFLLEINRFVRTMFFRESLQIDTIIKKLQELDTPNMPQSSNPKIKLLQNFLSKLQENYFSLSEQEIRECEAYAESKVDRLDLSEKSIKPGDKQIQSEAYEEAFTTMKNAKLKGKQYTLGRRINAKSIEGIQKDLSLLLSIKELNFPTPSEYKTYIELSESIVQKINDESKKILIIHSIGIIAISLGILAFALGTTTTPLGALLIVIGIQFCIHLAHLKAEKAFLQQPGYNWSIKNTIIPNCILQLLHKQNDAKPQEMRAIKPNQIEAITSST